MKKVFSKNVLVNSLIEEILNYVEQLFMYKKSLKDKPLMKVMKNICSMKNQSLKYFSNEWKKWAYKRNPIWEKLSIMYLDRRNI